MPRRKSFAVSVPRSDYVPHRSHDMGPWREALVTLASTARFGSIRACQGCEAEHALAGQGENHHDELDEQCPARPQASADPEPFDVKPARDSCMNCNHHGTVGFILGTFRARLCRPCIRGLTSALNRYTR